MLPLFITACVHDTNYAEFERVPIYDASGLYQLDYAQVDYYTPPQVSVQTSLTASPGKIVIITESYWGTNEQYIAATGLVAKHGAEKIVHINAPELFGRNRLEYAAIIAEKIIQDSEVRVLIINPAENGADHLVSLVREQRSDIFVVYIEDRHSELNDASIADLILGINMPELNAAFPAQAQKLGAEAIIFFAIDDCWDGICCSQARNIMRPKAEAIGLNFVEIFRCRYTIGCGSSLNMYMVEIMPVLIEKYGQNIAFAGLCDERFLWSFPGNGTIYPSSILTPPSPQFVAQGLFVPSLREMELEKFFDKNNTAFIIAETRSTLAEQNLLGRISTWPVSANIILTYTAVEYGIKWMNSEVPQSSIDLAALQQIMEDFIAAYSGEEGLGVTLTRRSQNHILVFMDFMTY